jgi:hypothetical protein
MAREVLPFIRGGFMRTRTISVFFALLAAALIAAGCAKSSVPKVESKSEVKSTNADGTRATTTTDAKQYGSTIVSKTERTGVGRDGKEKRVEETVVGTVTDFTPGKRIVVLTGDGSKHSYDLDDKKTNATVDRRVTVGTKVELALARDDSGNRSIRVMPAG